MWNCPPAAATESYNQDTTDSLEPSLASPLGIQRSSTTESQVMEGMSLSGGLEIGISCLTGPHFRTGGQKHTHTHITFILRFIFFIWLLVNSYHANWISCTSHMLLKCVSVLYILKYFKPFLPEYCFFIFVVICEFLMKFFPITFFAGQVS